jgi:hypothetical protein
MRSSDTGGGGLPADVPQSFMPAAGRAGALSYPLGCRQLYHGDDPWRWALSSAGDVIRIRGRFVWFDSRTPAEPRPADGILLQSGGGSGFEELR